MVDLLDKIMGDPVGRFRIQTPETAVVFED